jgi:hypothetical protein
MVLDRVIPQMVLVARAGAGNRRYTGARQARVLEPEF